MLKKGFILIMIAVFFVSGVIAVDVGSGAGISFESREVEPRIWMCNNRIVSDDAVESGRVSDDGEKLVERRSNYAFEGESIQWKVLVYDKNGIGDIVEVFGKVGGDIEVECSRSNEIPNDVEDSCNARLGELRLEKFDRNVMSLYDCVFTVETPQNMQGEHFLSVEVVDSEGLSDEMDEVERWFFNPIIGLSISGDLEFGEARPGTSVYSKTILVGNDAESGSGVMLDMFISGTSFFDSSPSGARCPSSNVLSLSNIRYTVAQGAYSSSVDSRSDSEGYVGVNYGDSFSRGFYNGYEILQTPVKDGAYWLANLLSPGAKMPLTFRIDVPEPCTGHFDSGGIFFWGEAV
jgi:hypothetical protein